MTISFFYLACAADVILTVMFGIAAMLLRYVGNNASRPGRNELSRQFMDLTRHGFFTLLALIGGHGMSG